jgi:hypothetical protein
MSNETQALENLESIDEDEGAGQGDVLLGTMYVFGTPMHLQAVRIDPKSDIQQALNDPYGRLEAIYAIEESALVPTTLPGWDGEYIVWLVPHGD